MRSGDNAIDGEFHQLGARSCTLATLVEIASAVGTDFIGMKALELAERAATEPFFVACVGRPDRGKSALINALVETSILPESTTPVNVIVTTLRYGPRRKATVHFADGQRKQIPIRAISDYVTEERNPVNQKAVGAVEVFVPSSLLAAGVCLVDVPGTASLSGGNQASIKALVPHFDAAIVALGVDPPISNDELSVAHEAARHVKHVLFVLNKVDRLSQRAREEAVISLEAILSRHFGRTAKPLFCVSANQSLNDVGGLGVERDERLLKATLVGLARESGAALAQLMEARALASVAPGLVAEIERFNDALVRPVKESRSRQARLDATIDEALRSLDRLFRQYEIERERFRTQCLKQHQSFLPQALRQASDRFVKEIREINDSTRTAVRSRAATVAEEIASSCLSHWLTAEAHAAECRALELSERWVIMANDFLHRLETFGDPTLSAVPRLSLGDAAPFTSIDRVAARYDVDCFAASRPALVSRIHDLFRTRTRRDLALERDAVRYLNNVLSANTSHILNDLDRRVGESANFIQRQIAEYLRGTRDGASAMLLRVEQKQRDGGPAIMRESRRLEELRQTVLSLQNPSTRPTYPRESKVSPSSFR